MSISAINCTPIKPQVSFKGERYEHRHSQFEECPACDSKVKGKDVKDPVAVIASLAALAGLAYGGAKGSAVGVSRLYNTVAEAVNKNAKKVAGEASEKAKTITPELGVLFNKGLGYVSEGADKLVGLVKKGIADDAKELTKTQKARVFVSNKLAQGVDLVKKGYNKVAYFNVADDVVGAARAQAGFENVAGAIGLASVVPEIVGRDANDDGVKDIMQKSQIAYTNREDKIAKTTADINSLGGVVSTVITNLA